LNDAWNGGIKKSGTFPKFWIFAGDAEAKLEG
jgi:hypothetical protein